MKHSSMDAWCKMPEHLLFEILLWLPVISLLRFKSVCKSWRTLIDSPIFISHHFDRNSGNDNLLGVCYNMSDDGCKEYCLLSGNKYEVYNKFDYGQLWHVVEKTELAFSSNGIICLVDYNRNMSLWNPAMKQLRSIPKSPVPRQGYFDPFLGFGFNVKSNDYNILRTTLCNESTSNNLVELYSLKADSWRTIHNNFVIPSRFYESHRYHISKDGTCFWIAYSKGEDDDKSDNDTDGNVILSFDLNEETYKTMPLPVGAVPFTAVIDFLDDKLAYIHGVDYCPFLNGHPYYEIWILHEYGVKESWSKVWKIGPTNISGTDDVLSPSRFILNGEFLLLTDSHYRKDSGEFQLYNLDTEENEYLELHQPTQKLGLPSKMFVQFRWSVRYTESLFSVKRVNDAH